MFLRRLKLECYTKGTGIGDWLEERVVPIRMPSGTAGQLLNMELVEAVYVTSLFSAEVESSKHLPVSKSSENNDNSIPLEKNYVRIAVVE